MASLPGSASRCFRSCTLRWWKSNTSPGNESSWPSTFRGQKRGGGLASKDLRRGGRLPSRSLGKRGTACTNPTAKRSPSGTAVLVPPEPEPSPQLPALPEEYKRWYAAGWFSDTRPLPPLTLASLPPRP
ncbi:hypothetical protein LIER_41032 [Lithospermum erythrorhizon]|uniref:Uncharacterized protein n=1 Tax=Lithospermum erythrorhizon TaxID=34254 RepID=A0AAV3R4E9_LITER